MSLETLFFGPGGLLRSGWRFVLAAVAIGTIAFILSAIAFAVLPVNALPAGEVWVLLEGSFVMLVAALAGGWLAARVFEGLPFRSLGAWFTQRWFFDLVLGLLIGGAAVTLAVAIPYIFGGIGFEANRVSTSEVLQTLALAGLVFTVAAAMEEVVFRGYLFQTFVRSDLAWLAILVTSVFFGAVHLGNPNATWIGAANTAIAGAWFCLAYLRTRTLWLVFGMHFMWNWLLGAVFGIEVSGLTDVTAAPVLNEIDAGPVWLTGEAYGIEGSISCTLALLAAIAATWWLPFLKASEEMEELSSDSNPEKALLKQQTVKS